MLAVLSGARDDRLGDSLTTLGDFDGDGFDDILATAPASSGGFGGVSVHFGNPEGALSVSELGGGSQAAQVSNSVLTSRAVRGPSDASGGYDFNGDGLHDFVVTAGWYTPPNGNLQDEFDASLRLVLGNAQQEVVTSNTFFGPTRIHFATNVDMVRDFDGDGLADILTSSQIRRRAHLIFGQTEPVGEVSRLGTTSTFPDGRLQYQVLDELPGTGNTSIVQASIGDINQDGRSDIAIGSGTSMQIILGQANRRDLATITITNLPDEVTLIEPAGDLNGDGVDDLLLGFAGALDGQGSVQVAMGDASFFSPDSAGTEVDFALLTTMNIPAILEGEDFRFGVGGYAAGDTDGTGRNAVAIAGTTSAFQVTSVDSSSVLSVAIDTEINNVRRAIGDFDFDGDGLDDLFFSDPNFETGSGRFRSAIGQIDLTLGQIDPAITSSVGDDTDDLIEGTEAAESLIGGRGNDELRALGTGDVLRGGSGDDRIAVSIDGLARADGGRGKDTLEITTTESTLAVNDLLTLGFREFEAFDFAQAATGNNTIELQRLPLLNLSETSNSIDFIVDAAMDTVVRSPDWSTSIQTSRAGDDFVVVQNDLAIANVIPIDGPYFTITDTVVDEGDEGMSQATLTIRLHNADGAAASVSYSTLERDATEESKDFVPIAPTVLDFAAGETEKQVTVDVLGDLNIENETEIFAVELSNPQDAGIPLPVGYVRIIDNESRTTSGDIAEQRRWEVTESSVFLDGDVSVLTDGSLTITEGVNVVGGQDSNANGDAIQRTIAAQTGAAVIVEGATIENLSRLFIDEGATLSTADATWVDSLVFNTDPAAAIAGNDFIGEQPLVADAALVFAALENNSFANDGNPLGVGLLSGIPDADVTLSAQGDIDHYYLHSRPSQNGFGHYQFANLTIAPGIELLNQGNTQVVLDIANTLSVGEGSHVRVRNDFYADAPSIDAQLEQQDLLTGSTLVGDGVHRIDGLFGKGGDGGSGGKGEDVEPVEQDLEDLGIVQSTSIAGAGGAGGSGGFGGGIGGPGGPAGAWTPGSDGFDGSSVDGEDGPDGVNSIVDSGTAADGTDATTGSTVSSAFGPKFIGSRGASGGAGGYGGGVLSVYASEINVASGHAAFVVSGQQAGNGGAGELVGVSPDDQQPIVRFLSEGQDGQDGLGGVLVIAAPNFTPTMLDAPLSRPVPLSDSRHGMVVGSAQSVIMTTRGATAAPKPTVSVTIAETDARIAEDSSQVLEFMFTRTGPTADPLTVVYSVAGEATEGTDYTGTATTIEIPAGSASAIVSVDPIDDDVEETDESIIVMIEPDAAYDLDTSTSASATGTILDNDSSIVLPTIAVSTASQSATEDAGTVTFDVTIGAPASSDVVVPYTITGTATDNDDFTVAESSVTIPAGQTSATVTLTILDDTADESDQETIVITLEAPDGAQLGGEIVHTVTIVDDDMEDDTPNDMTGTLDVTGNGLASPFLDGILIIRYLLGQPDANLEEPRLIPATATRANGAEIRLHLDAAGMALDANGDGRLNALQDGILIVRHLFGQPDANLEDTRLIPEGSTRSTGTAIRAHLDALLPGAASGPTSGEGESLASLFERVSIAGNDPYDVNADGTVSALDVLNIVNSLKQNSLSKLESPSHDVNADGFVTARDALAVINRLQADSQAPPIPQPEPTEWLIDTAFSDDEFLSLLF